MNKKIEDYLHLYMGCEVFAGTHRCKLIGIEDGAIVMHEVKGRHIILFLNIKPILRPLSDITKEEDQEYEYIRYKKDLNIYEGNAMQTMYLLSLHFDLFGLIESGLALDATKLPKENITHGTV